MAKKRDWVKIRTEYETTKTSHRKLAEKYSIPYPTIRDRAKREGWKASANRTKDAIVAKTIEKTSQKLAERRAQRIADEIDPALEATEMINRLVLETLKDEKQFNRHMITKKESRSIAKVGSESRQWVETMETDVVDTKRLQELARALQISKELQRTLQGLLAPADKAKNLVDKQKIKLDKERLELQKAEAAQKSKITDEGIIIQMEGELDEWSE